MQFDLAMVLWPHLDLRAKTAIERRLTWAEQHADIESVEAKTAMATLRRRIVTERSGP